MCARGILLTDIALDFVRSEICAAGRGELGPGRGALRRDGGRGRCLARRRGRAAGAPRHGARRRAALRGPELRGARAARRTAGRRSARCGAFAVEHARTNGYDIPGRGVELVNCRLQRWATSRAARRNRRLRAARTEAARIGGRRVYYDPHMAGSTRRSMRARSCPPAARLTGPAVIEEMSATSIVFPGQWATLDADGNMSSDTTTTRRAGRPRGRRSMPDTHHERRRVPAPIRSRWRSSPTACSRSPRTWATSWSAPPSPPTSRSARTARSACSTRAGAARPGGAHADASRLAASARGDAAGALPPEQMKPGDAFICNDVFLARGTHLPDITIVTPVFHEGRVAFFAVNIGHHSDVGGPIPGSMSQAARGRSSRKASASRSCASCAPASSTTTCWS